MPELRRPFLEFAAIGSPLSCSVHRELIAVALNEHYSLKGMWRLPVAGALSLFAFRVKFREYQATQKLVKANNEMVELRVIKCPG
jgi:hypothetical protein